MGGKNVKTEEFLLIQKKGEFGGDFNSHLACGARGCLAARARDAARLAVRANHLARRAA